MSEIIIRENKEKVKSIKISQIFMLMACILILIVGIIKTDVLYIIIGIVAALFFGTCFIYIIKRASNSKPILVITEDGINDMSTMSSVGFIAWDEIESIYFRKILGQDYIGVGVYDVDKLINRVSRLKQISLKLSLKLKYPPVAILLNTADMGFNQVLSFMQLNLEEYRKK